MIVYRTDYSSAAAAAVARLPGRKDERTGPVSGQTRVSGVARYLWQLIIFITHRASAREFLCVTCSSFVLVSLSLLHRQRQLFLEYASFFLIFSFQFDSFFMNTFFQRDVQTLLLGAFVVLLL